MHLFWEQRPANTSRALTKGNGKGGPAFHLKPQAVKRAGRT